MLRCGGNGMFVGWVGRCRVDFVYFFGVRGTDVVNVNGEVDQVAAELGCGGSIVFVGWVGRFRAVYIFFWLCGTYVGEVKGEVDQVVEELRCVGSIMSVGWYSRTCLVRMCGSLGLPSEQGCGRFGIGRWMGWWASLRIVVGLDG